jgi:MFS family permease
LNALIGNIIAGIIVKHPTLSHWRKLFLGFFVIYFIGGIIFILLGSAVPEKWATFKSQEQHEVHAEEEIIPMQEQQQQPGDETNQNKHVNA